MAELTVDELLKKIEGLEIRLADTEQLIDAIKAGEVDAFAINKNDQPEIYTLQSGDYAYRILIEEFGEGAINVTEDGLIVYTNAYFFELLGKPYEEVIGSSVLELVEEDYKEKFEELFTKSIKGNSKGEICLIGKHRNIPVYISLTSLQPKLATVGIIITDLTEKKKNEETILQYQNDLEGKNLELIQSNAELASFAYVASHDLQEPLRKIQTFSSRIINKELDNLSAAGKDSFQRIIASAERMQDLITALLNYSRLNTDEVSYTATDLQKVIDDIKVNLSERIEETNAEIYATGMPVLQVIPFQFSQLLSNIIINSIKYSKPDISPVIHISSKKVIERNGYTNAALAGKEMWEIKIADNGIGFEQEYAERIFELFQRLHGRAEYEGTGIGLAICKRIMQNHNGYIKARGELGVGATFSLYFPANN